MRNPNQAKTERAKLVSVVAALGCSGGKIGWDRDDREFEVDNVRCNDGKNYDLKFNADYTIITMRLDD